MSRHPPSRSDRATASDSERLFGSERTTAEMRGPIDRVESHEENDHFALIYESQREQFEAVVPFIQEGLDRGERCLYVADDNTVDQVLAAMRERGIDVDAVLESGALTMYTARESYKRSGEFETDAMLEFWEETLVEAEAAEFTGVRATAEMTWALEDEGTELDELCEYEELLNPLYDGEEYSVLCQYNRERFPTASLHHVLKTHPYIVYDETTVCQNFYYTPPEEYFGPEDRSRELDRKLATLVDRTDARSTIEARERYQRDLYETIADPEISFEEEVERLLELGRDRLDLEIGYFTRTYDDGERFEIVAAVGDHDTIEPGVTDTLEGTYCEKLFATPGAISVRDVEERGWAEDPAYQRFGLDAYFGTTVNVGGEEYGSLCFASRSTREQQFSDAEQTFLDLMGQWIEYELERRRRERFLRESYRITADSDSGFEAKLDQLLELGCEWFGLEMGGLNHRPSRGGEFRLEKGLGFDVDPGKELWTDPGYGRFSRRTIDAEEPVAIADVTSTDWKDDQIHHEFGLTSYLGTRVTDGSTAYGTLWFGSTDPRDQPFSETEQTFIELIGQWVSYELERRQREQALEQSNERLEQFAYAASHDLQEPLRMVTSYLQLLEERYDDALDEDGEEFLEFAVDGADRMREMIDGLLEYSRVETQGGSFEPVELEGVVDDVLTDLRLQVEETDAEITVGGLPRVEGDASQLRQVFQNLLSNAIQYSGDSPPRAHVDATPQGRDWVVSVDDEGIGIDPSDQDRVFSVFDRLHSREEYEGTGIGLALCERIVERHGGEIWVDSEPGEGATFSFTLSAAPDQ